MKTAAEIVADQAEDPKLWVTIDPEYVRRALRSLHEAVEQKSAADCAKEVLD